MTKSIQSLLVAAAACALLAGPALAKKGGSDGSAKLTPQQNKMGECNKQAGDKKGDDRKAFMKECLSNKPAGAGSGSGTAQQNKMVTCNKEAGAKKGDERKAFMKACLSKK